VVEKIGRVVTGGGQRYPRRETPDRWTVELSLTRMLATRPALARVIIMGLGSQTCPCGPTVLRTHSVGAGYRVVRFATATNGLSAKLQGLKPQGSGYRRLAP